AAVTHAFGLSVRRGDRPGVEVVAADHDRRLDAAFAHELVDAQAEAGAIAIAEPENSRRQTLEGDALARQANPAHQRLVPSEHFERGLIRDANVVGIA